MEDTKEKCTDCISNLITTKKVIAICFSLGVFLAPLIFSLGGLYFDFQNVKESAEEQRILTEKILRTQEIIVLHLKANGSIPDNLCLDDKNFNDTMIIVNAEKEDKKRRIANRDNYTINTYFDLESEICK